MRRFHVVGPDRGNGWVLVELRPRLVGGLDQVAVGRYPSREEAEAECDKRQAPWDAHEAERRREQEAWDGSLAAMAAAGAERIDGRRTRVRGGW